MYVVILKALNMSIIARVLVQHMPEFHGEKDKVTWHIPFIFSKEITQKVVSIESSLFNFHVYINIRYPWE